MPSLALDPTLQSTCESVSSSAAHVSPTIDVHLANFFATLTPPCITPSSSDYTTEDIDQRRTLYLPHGKWAEAALNPIQDSQELALLTDSSTCPVSLRQGRLAGKPVMYISKLWSLLQYKEWQGFTSELALYNSPKHLKPLQGLVVSQLINVYMTSTHINTVMELPSESFWVEASQTMPDVLKERCIEAFEKLHAQGVLHGDVELRHMLIGADCNVTIIDFRRSRTSIPIPDVGIQAASPEDFRMEMRRVKCKLNYKDAKEQELAKMRRAAELRRRNEIIVRDLASRGICTRVEDMMQPSVDDMVNPAVPSDVWSREWTVARGFTPRRFIVPGQSSEDVKASMDAFLSSVTEMESKKARKSLLSTNGAAKPIVSEEEIFALLDDRYLLAYQLRKRKRENAYADSNRTTDTDGDYPGVKRRRSSLNCPPQSPLSVSPSLVMNASPSPPHSHDRPRKRKRTHTNTTAPVEQITFSDFMLLEEIEKDSERLQRKDSLISITAEYGSDRERSLSPPPVDRTPNTVMSDPVPRRESPPLSSEEAVSRINETSPYGALASSAKSCRPIIARDFVDRPFDGPKGYYVPHPPTENRIGLERAKYIRRCNAMKCMDMGLRYPAIENEIGDVVPYIAQSPYNFQFDKDVEKAEKKRRRQRGLGGLKRKKDMEQIGEEERQEIDRLRRWEDAQLREGSMSKIHFSRLSNSESSAQESNGRYKPYSRSSPTRGILKKVRPIKTFSYQNSWDDEEFSPKLGPLPLEHDRSGGFGMLGVQFRYEITRTEEAYREEVLSRLRASDTFMAKVGEAWKEEEDKMQKVRQLDLASSPEEFEELRGTPASSSPSRDELEEERLVEEQLDCEY